MVDECTYPSRDVSGGEVEGVDVGAGGGYVGEDLGQAAVADERADVPDGSHDQAVSFDAPSGDDVPVVGGEIAVDTDRGFVVVGAEAPERVIALVFA